MEITKTKIIDEKTSKVLEEVDQVLDIKQGEVITIGKYLKVGDINWDFDKGCLDVYVH
jgi:choline kinase